MRFSGERHVLDPIIVNRSLQVRREYLSDGESGLETALRNAIKTLFSEPKLPDNPYFYLADVLSAYVDQSNLWRESNEAITSCFDLESDIDVSEPSLRLCKHSAQAWGLPHVLRVASRDGIKVLEDVLSASLPDNFFPDAAPYLIREGYTAQVMCSVQGPSALWRPQWSDCPELHVRADVLLVGNQHHEAVDCFLDLILSDMRALDKQPVYYLHEVALLSSPSAPSPPRGDKTLRERDKDTFPLRKVLGAPATFKKVALPHVSSGGYLQCRVVALVEKFKDPQDGLTDRKLLFQWVVKRYHLHFQSTQNPTGRYLSDDLTHSGSLPFESLFEGYCLQRSTARMYMRIFTAPGRQLHPYAEEVLAANRRRLISQVESLMSEGEVVAAFSTSLFLLMTFDPEPLRGPVLNQDHLRSMEDITSSARDTKRGPVPSEDHLLSAVPNLLRMINSGAAEMKAIVRHVEGLLIVIKQWPAKRAATWAAAKAEPVEVEEASSGDPQGGSIPEEVKGAPASLSAPDTPLGHAAQVAAWLDQVDLPHRLLEQLVELRSRMSVALGDKEGLFAGFATILDQLLAPLAPGTLDLSAADCDSLLRNLRQPLELAHHLLDAAAITLADGLLDRCRDVLSTLRALGVKVKPNRGQIAKDYVTPEEQQGLLGARWALDVKTVTHTQVRSGALADRVAAEGVMLQYVVDSQLDQFLSSLYLQLTKPPLALNPYPQLLHLVRAKAAQMELWGDTQEEGWQALSNPLVMMGAPHYIYIAPSRRQQGAGAGGTRRSARQQGVGDDDADVGAVYGCFAAVMLCNTVAAHALQQSLGALTMDRNMKQGAYDGQVVPAFVGDITFSNAMKLAATDAAAGPSAGPVRGLNQWAPFEDPRFFSVDIEDHYLITGPDLEGASRMFAEWSFSHLEALYRTSPHLMAEVKVGMHRWAVSDVMMEADKKDQYIKRLTVATWKHQEDSSGSLVVVTLMAAVKQGLYVPVKKHLTFTYREVQVQGLGPDPTTTISTMAAGTILSLGSDPDVWGPQPMAVAAPEAGPPRRDDYWDSRVYQRVFLTETGALTWESWHKEHGDPAQPYHVDHVAKALAEKAKAARSSGNLLNCQQLLLLRGLVRQDPAAIWQCGKSCQSTARELRCLQEINATLTYLLSPATQAMFQDKLEKERVRKLFVMYVSRVTRALSSPKYCYFSGFARVVERVMTQLQREVLGALVLRPEHELIMQQMNSWTQCCEYSVALSLYDSLDDDIKETIHE